MSAKFSVLKASELDLNCDSYEDGVDWSEVQLVFPEEFFGGKKFKKNTKTTLSKKTV